MDAIYKTVCGIDVHQHMLMCSIVKVKNGKIHFITKEFGNFHKDFSTLKTWLNRNRVERVVVESTGVYWSSLYDYLTDVGHRVDVVNAYHVKNVPGRKTDVSDSQWLAELCACGLLSPSFIPPRQIRSLRLLTRYRTKTSRQISSERNRMYKILEYSGIRLTYAMSKADCVTGMAIIRAIANGEEVNREVGFSCQRVFTSEDRRIYLCPVREDDGGKSFCSSTYSLSNRFFREGTFKSRR